MKSSIIKGFALTMLVGVIASCAASMKVDPVEVERSEKQQKKEDTRSAKRNADTERDHTPERKGR